MSTIDEIRRYETWRELHMVAGEEAILQYEGELERIDLRDKMMSIWELAGQEIPNDKGGYLTAPEKLDLIRSLSESPA